MNIITKEDCIIALNALAKDSNINTIRTILSIYLDENTNPNKEQAIDLLTQLPTVYQCLEYAISQLCKKYDIKSIIQEGKYIYFY